ncbi:MAG TPA: CHAT domain-containing protein [Steroidobacteraceae bacterium]|nr:CHAT domain-containing protein [Steroidobacteraceae bacterium]
MKRRHAIGAAVALAATMLEAGAAQIHVGDAAITIDEPLSVFEPGDRLIAGPDGALRTVRDVLELRTRHEFVEPVRVTVQRGGVRTYLDLGAEAHWGLHSPVTLEAAKSRRRAPDLESAALPLEEQGYAALLRWDGATATRVWREALAMRNLVDTASIATVKARLGSAEAALLRRDLAAADGEFGIVDELLQKNWPRAPLRFRALLGRAIIAAEKRDLATSEILLKSVDTLAQTVMQPSLVEIDALRVWARLQYSRGDIDDARQRYESAYALAQRLVPDSATVALLESSIGVMIWRQGDLAGAERRFSHALEIAMREAPGSVLVAGLLMNLGTVHHLRRDFAAAERNYRRAVDFFEAVSSNSPETLRALTNLALAQGLGGKPREANLALERVLAAQEAREPNQLDVAYTQNGLGLNYGRLDDWQRAASSYTAAIAIREANGALGIGLANTLTSRGDARLTLGLADAAQADLVRALAIYDRLAPGSHARAECLHSLGRIARQQGDTAAAMDYFRRAIDVLDAQLSHLGGSDEARSSYSAYFSSYYKDYVELLLRSRRAPEAFETLERYRGRVLRAALAGEGRVMDALLPADLRAERDVLLSAIDKARNKLQSIEKPADEAEQVGRLLAELESLRARQDVLDARIRERAPRVAEIDQARAATVDQVRAALPRDTALLSFAVLPESVEIFVVTPGRGSRSIAWKHANTSAAALRERVDRLVFLLATPSEAPDARQALDAGSHEMYDLLIAPVAAELARYPNWIVVPDGPLHRLPFGALRERVGAGARYLIESRALTTVVSATVFRQLQQRDSGRAYRPGLAAFGDPQLNSGARLSTSTARGDVLRDELARPLPWARQEVEEIARLVGASAEIYLGAEATEGRVRAVAARAPALHFASHGVLDERSPLDSFLLLAGPVPGAGTSDDGRLSAREVFELPPLAAALVILSSCSTSASADNDGEGLIGLTRAFQGNGAGAVVSSLWKVSDRSTAELMLEFYRHWPAVSADEALARAQRKFITRHPFYWAAFEVSGARKKP